MRVIGGRFRGFTLKAPAGDRIRPTADRVREAVFNMLAGDVDGAIVLDLFAGTGAMGLEALSRGASHCSFIDISPLACRTVRENIERLGVGEMCRVVRADVRSFLRRPVEDDFLGGCGLVFADPPYERGFPADVVEDLGRWPGLAEDARVVVESEARRVPPAGEGEVLVDGVTVDRKRRYGDTTVIILRYPGRRTVADV